MITKFKLFESLSKSVLNGIIYNITQYVVDATNDDFDYEDIYEDCPYYDEIAILHQQEYIDDIYSYFYHDYDDDNFIDKYNISPEDFRKIYNDMIIKAKEKILKLITKKPSLYSKYPVDYEGLGIPEWIKAQNKYNL